MSLVLDTGALLAIEGRNRAVMARLRVAQRAQLPVRTSSGAVAQAWRGGPRQAALAMVLRGIEERPIDARSSRQIGRVLAAAAASDVVDAHVAILCDDDAHLLTSDPADLDRLLEALGRMATIERL